MLRRLPVFVFAGLAVLAAFGGAVAFRGALVGAAAEAWLARHGFPDADIEVQRVGFGRTLASADFGTAGPKVGGLRIDYRPFEILHGRIRAIHIADVTAIVDTATGNLFAALLNAFPSGGEGPSDGRLPRVVLDNVALDVRGTALGDLAVSFEGSFEPGPTTVSGTLEIAIEAAGAAINAKLSASGPRSAPRVTVAADGRADLGRVEWPAAFGTAPQSGRVSVSLSGATTPDLGHGTTLAAWVDAPGRIDIDLHAETVTIPGRLRGGKVEAGLTVETGHGLVVGVDGPIHASATSVAAGSLPGAATGLFPARLSIVADGTEPLLRLAPAQGGWQAHAAAVFGIEAAKGAAEAQAAADIRLDEGLRPVAVDSASLGLTARDLPLGPNHLGSLVWTATGGGPLTDLALAGPLRIENLSVGAAGIGYEGPLSVARGRDGGVTAVAGPQGTLTVAAGSGLDFRASGLSATARIGANATLSAGEAEATVEQTGNDPVLAPLRVTATARPEGSALRLDGRLMIGGGTASLPVQGRYDPAAGTGFAEIGPGSLAFAPGRLQPAALSPRLGAIAEASGGLDVQARWTLGVADGSGSGRVELHDLTFTSGAARVEGASGTLVFDSLTPPRTPAGQVVTARRIVAGPTLENVRLRGWLRPESGAPAIAIEHAEAAFAGGAVTVDDAVVVPSRPQNTVRIGITDVSLETLLERMAQRLDGRGRLSGTIPVRFGEQGFAIADGALEAETPGVLNVHVPIPTESLGGQGEQVALVARALEDFRYDVLEIRIDRPYGGVLRLGATLQGSNPKVLDGHPFRFNITVSGNLDPILAALREGRAVGADLLNGMIGGGP